MTASDADKLAQAVSAFGAAATAALSNPAISGEPEEQLRTPLVALVKALAPLSGLGGYDVELVGETKLSDLTVRPDFAVTRRKVLIGFVEVKAPGKGADPTKFKAKHDKEQWEKLKALPNLIYTDGNAFSLWQDGERALPMVTLGGDVENAGKALTAPPELLALFTAFYGWSPIPPRTPKQLAETTARLCRLLRDEVSEQLDRKAPGLTSLAEDWRKLLFPAATDPEFADGYAQAVTFGLLMARARNIPLADGIEEAAKILRRSNSLIGSALRLLTEEVDEEHTLDTSLKTLTADASEEVQKALGADLRLYITDTLSDPDEETAWIPSSMAGVAESRRQANHIKRHEPITVVMGNPPYKEKAKGHGGWVENRGPGLRAPLDDWQPPVSWGVGAHAKHLRNLYVYFWRWAAWKVFGGEAYRDGSDKTEADWTNRRGIVAFITVAGFLNGPGFQKMRADLRRDADEIWVIDCSPEGHQPPVASRIFQGVQQPVCIVVASRPASADKATPAKVRFRSLPEGDRELKFEALADIALDDGGWVDALDEWRAPFLPAGAADWAGYPALEDLFRYHGSGVMTGRTWVIAPDSQSLKDRWNRLLAEKDLVGKEALFHPHMNGDRTAGKVVREPLAGHAHPPISVVKDTSAAAEPVHYGFRSFDRQWIIPDNRLINRANPTLWRTRSARQIYLTGLLAHSPSSGPALTITGLVPDLHHYKGSFGGRTLPLWADAAATRSNISPGLLAELSLAYGREVGAEEVMAYIAAVAAHPGYVERFRANLKQPGLRIPLTADRGLFDAAVALGREVIWLHTFGERFAEGRPPGAPRVEPASAEPTIPAGGVLPTSLEDMPHELEYDAAARRLKIGAGYIANVSPEVWAYEVSGKRVLSQWWSYRRKDRSKPPMGDKRPPSKLSEIQPTTWLPEYTTELLNVLRVLTRLVALEPSQDDLLRRIVEGPTISADVLSGAGALTDSSAEAASEVSPER